MGQTQSNESTQGNGGLAKNSNSSAPFITSKISTELIYKNFKRIEEHSLKESFGKFSYVDESGITVVDEQSFLQYLRIPEEIGAAPLIYRSFRHLANYPSKAHSTTPLNYDGFVKAIAIYCDKAQNVIPEDRTKLLFDSFSTCDNYVDENSDNVSRVDCRSMLNLLTAIVWIMTSEMVPMENECEKIEKILEIHANLLSSENINQIRDEMTHVVEQMARYDVDIRHSNLSSTDIISNQSITWPTFQKFILRNSPNIFCGLSSYMKGQFLIGETVLLKRPESLFFGPQVQYWPLLDSESRILDSTKMATLSWMLPNEVTKCHQWNRLYSGSMDGFSMNGFSSRVRKFQGPTLMFICGTTQIGSLPNSFVSSSSSFGLSYNARSHNNQLKPGSCEFPEEIFLGAYVADPWSISSTPRTTFGSNECALFEMSPSLELFRASKKGKRYVYFNSSVGIGFGGLATSGEGSNKIEPPDANSFVLQIDNSLLVGRYRFDPSRELSPTYESSETRTFFDIPFLITDIEVFGIGEAKVEQGRGPQQKEIKATKNSIRQPDVNRHRSISVDKDFFRLSGVFDYASLKNHK